MTATSTCHVLNCPYYANEGCYGACSEHSKYKAIKIIAIKKPELPKEILNLFWEFYHVHSVAMTDDQIVARLGLNADDILVDTETVNERAVWLRHHHLPFLHCDNIEGALDVLSLPHEKRLRADDAQKLMVMIDLRHPSRWTRIALEKAIVMRTLNRGSLPRDMFSVGLCYYDRPMCMSNMSITMLRQIVY